MATHVGDEFHALGRTHQSAALALMGQGVVVAQFGHSKLVTHITGSELKDGLQFTLKQRFIEITGNW